MAFTIGNAISFPLIAISVLLVQFLKGLTNYVGASSDIRCFFLQRSQSCLPSFLTVSGIRTGCKITLFTSGSTTFENSVNTHFLNDKNAHTDGSVKTSKFGATAFISNLSLNIFASFTLAYQYFLINCLQYSSQYIL